MLVLDAQALIALNVQFYQTIAIDFDDSRQYFWRGWHCLDSLIATSPRILDVACGNGRFAQYCGTINPSVRYTGVDSNSVLLENARASLHKSIAVFHEKNILLDTYLDEKEHDLVVCFGFLHHIPSLELRQRFFQMLASNTSQNGRIVVSLWQFEKNQALMSRVVAQPGDTFKNILLEDGDYILDWKRGISAMRYCHAYSIEEINTLLSATGLVVALEYEADGKNNDNRYLILQKNLTTAS